MKKWIISALIAAVAMACSGDKESAQLLGSNPQGTPPTGVGHPPVDLPPESREIKRMTVEMLRNSIAVVAGLNADGNPIAWTEKFKGQQVNVLGDGVLAKTLGKPDYITTTSEPAEPTALYVKFMDDMARNVCDQIIAADVTKQNAEDRTLLRFVDLQEYEDAASINTNLRYLKLRLHAEKVADSDDATVAPLKKVFDTAAAEAKGQPASGGWRAVCVALFLSPEFHLY